jgi:hypothetical protein
MAMQSQALVPLLAPLLFGMVLVWFVLIKMLFNRLERAHPQKYESMGRPSLFLRNNIENGFATMKFLFAREHRAMGDAYLSKLSDSMLVFLVAYLLVFAGLGFIVPFAARTAMSLSQVLGNVA